MCSFPVGNKIAHVEALYASQALCWPFKPPPLPSTFSEDVTAVTPRLLQGRVFVRSGNAPWFTTGGQRCRPTWASRGDSQLPRVHFLTSWSEDVFANWLT